MSVAATGGRYEEDTTMKPAARLMSFARDTLTFAERSLGPLLDPLLDLFIRLWLAQSFFASGLVKPRPTGTRRCGSPPTSIR